SEHGRMVYFKSETDKKGQFVSVKIDEANGISLIGEVV
ncbi:MAG: TRAM domain-containing protein, partial [Clostridia bacterium]|nr:TRAM domain-containing protein [Clostridia bacterium]